MINEYDFYMNLYDDFIKTRDKEKEKILWKARSIIKLMKFTKGNEEGDFCENALRMIMLLFKNYIFTPYELNSYELEINSNQEREIIIPILKNEFENF
jgi:hypothetical protein